MTKEEYGKGYYGIYLITKVLIVNKIKLISNTIIFLLLE